MRNKFICIKIMVKWSVYLNPDMFLNWLNKQVVRRCDSSLGIINGIKNQSTKFMYIKGAIKINFIFYCYVNTQFTDLLLKFFKHIWHFQLKNDLPWTYPFKFFDNL